MAILRNLSGPLHNAVNLFFLPRIFVTSSTRTCLAPWISGTHNIFRSNKKVRYVYHNTGNMSRFLMLFRTNKFEKLIRKLDRNQIGSESNGLLVVNPFSDMG